MGKYYCDYCDVFLTHDSSSVRKAHNAGRNHLTNVKDYYASLGHDQAQDIIDQITKMYESGVPPNRPYPQPPSGLNGLMQGLGGPPRFGGGPMSMGPPPPFFGGPPMSGPPGFNGPPPGFNGPPGGMGGALPPPPGFMGGPPPGFFGGPPGGGPPGPGAFAPPSLSGGPQGPSNGTGGGSPAGGKLINGMNPERARALGLI